MNLQAMTMKTKSSPTRDRILNAADALLCDRGFDGVSMRDVALKADVNKASVFYYFNSKAELFEKVLLRYYLTHQEAFKAVLGQDGNPSERVHNIIDAYLDFIGENRRYAQLIQQLVAGPSEFHSLIGQNIAEIFGLTRRGLEGLVPDTGPLSARQFFITFSGLIINYFTYAPVLGTLWGEPKPLSDEGLAERREHIHWLLDALLEKLYAS